LSNILNIAGKLVLFYLGLGILIWFIQFSSGIYFEQIYRTGTYPNGWACRGGQAVAAYKLLGFDASGLKQILLWGPTLYAAQGQGMGIGDVLVPTECAAAGEISAGASVAFATCGWKVPWPRAGSSSGRLRGRNAQTSDYAMRRGREADEPAGHVLNELALTGCMSSPFLASGICSRQDLNLRWVAIRKATQS
jgi:hypothetical protein